MNCRKVKIKISWGAKIRHSRKFNFNFSLRQVVWWATTRWTSKTFVMLMTENWHSLFQPRNNNKRHYLSYERERTNSCLGSNNKTEQIRMTLWWPTSYQTQTHCSAGLFFLSDSVIRKIVIMKKYPSKDRPTKSQQQSGFRGNESEQP